MATRHPKRYRAMLKKLVEARHERGLRQVEMAELLGVSQQWFSAMERGSRRIDPTELEELAAIYEMPLLHFLERDED